MCIKNKVKKLNVLYQNVQGLNTKLHIFKLNVLSSDYDVIILTETWLTPSVFDNEMFDSRYVVFRKDRDLVNSSKKAGGGVLVAVKSEFVCDLLHFSSGQVNVDEVWIKINFTFTEIYVCAVYIPPNISNHIYDIFFENLENKIIGLSNNVLIIGDFNIPGIVNINENYNLSVVETRYMQCINLLNLKQFNNILNERKRYLDLLICDTEVKVERSDFPLVPENRDHPSLFGQLYLFPMNNRKEGKTFNSQYNFKKADFLGLYNILEVVDWSEINDISDVNFAVETFYRIFYSILDQCVPMAQKENRIYPPWFNKKIIRDIKKKDYYRKKYKKSNSELDKQKFVYLRATIKTNIKHEYDKYISHIEGGINNNPSSFWKYLSSVKCNSKSLTSSMTYEGVQIGDDEQIVDAFAKYFQSTFTGTTSTYSTQFESNKLHFSSTLSINSIDRNDIITAVKKMKPKKSVGPDGIPSYIYKGCIEFLIAPLLKIFNLILKTKTYPDYWKYSKICPIFKAGNKEEIANYRPIALICTVSKIFESILHQKIYTHVSRCIADEQHGFMTKKSTVTNLLSFNQFTTEIIDNNSQVDVIFTDFAKAFDKVNHDILLKKLDSFGLSDDIIKLFASYLQSRKQYIVFKGCSSKEIVTPSGVPQGSNLGPLFFLCLINDLPSKVIFSKCQLFADDFKLYKEINSIGDCKLLQTDIDNIYQWSVENRLFFNIDKCFSMKMTRKKSLVDFQYTMNNEVLSRRDVVKDLGVSIDSRLTFDNHINDIVNRAYRLLGFVIRNSCNFKNQSTLIMLYNSYVRSILEYSSLIWSPFYTTHKDKIEKIQKKFLRYLYLKKTGIYHYDIPYQQLLEQFNFYKLESRRNISHLIFLYKVLHNRIDCPFLLNRLQLVGNRHLHRNSLLFYTPGSQTNLGLNSPLCRLCKLINNSKHTDIFYDGFNAFKKKIMVEYR